MTNKRGRGRPAKPPAKRYEPWHVTLPPEVAQRVRTERQDGETDSALVARLLRKATHMSYIRIAIDTSDSAMTGSDGWQDADASASVAAFVQMVANEVAKVFPGYDVTVAQTDHANTVEFSDEDAATEDADWHKIEQDKTTVREIISDVYQTQDWVR